jgi:hypothetical protein
VPLRGGTVGGKRRVGEAISLCEERADLARDLVNLVIDKRRTARWAEPVAEQTLSDLSAADPVAAEGRLQVHRLPNRARLDALSLQAQTDRIAVDSGDVGIDRQTGVPQESFTDTLLREYPELRQRARTEP